MRSGPHTPSGLGSSPSHRTIYQLPEHLDKELRIHQKTVEIMHSSPYRFDALSPQKGGSSSSTRRLVWRVNGTISSPAI